MAVTTLDLRTALILIDLQNGIVSLPTVHPIAEILGRARALADSFRRHGLPVVLVNVTSGAPGRTEQPPRVRGELPAGWADLVSEVNQHPSDHTVTKRTWGALRNTDLEEHLQSLGVTQVVLAGVSTTSGVESTARQAYEAGFNVTLAIDAMTDMNLEAHINSTTRIFPKLGETGTTQEVLELLDKSRL
ncbi:MAG: entB [Acidobacteriaceae bacterium]|nr:entB [Acidobacteriaceae bacterium]